MAFLCRACGMSMLVVMSMLAVVLAACGGSNQTSRAGSTTSAPSTPPTTDASAQRWTMPDLVGANLQDAQDRIQRLTGNRIFVTTSHDASGARRNQVLDSNWKVCTQNVPAGSTITAETRIDFGAVQLDERCP